MLHMLLLVLKVIGGLILAVLMLAVLLLAVVLLVPVRYRISAMKYTSAVVEANVSWLCHLIGFFFRLDTEEEEERRIHLRLRIACFCLYDNLKPKKERIKKERPSKNKQHTAAGSETTPKQLPEPEKISTAEIPLDSGRTSTDKKVTVQEKKQTTKKVSEPKKTFKSKSPVTASVRSFRILRKSWRICVIKKIN